MKLWTNINLPVGVVGIGLIMAKPMRPGIKRNAERGITLIRLGGRAGVVFVKRQEG